MSPHQAAYPEQLFQWIWQHVQFDCRALQTVCGKPVTILDPGRLNHGAGPDFLAARLLIGSLEWNGSVEIHRHPREWKEHGHHINPGFNSVILHVVFEDIAPEQVYTQDGNQPFTLQLKSHVSKPLYRLYVLKQKSGIPCSGNTAFINQEAFERQIEFAHQDYLEYKTEEILADYPPGMPLSKAWMHCLIAQFYRTLGIPNNRDSMYSLFLHLEQRGYTNIEEIEEFIKTASSVAFADPGASDFGWQTSGCRPASHPRNRVVQAAALHARIRQIPFDKFIHSGPSAWDKLMQIPDSYKPGRQLIHLLRQLAFIPSLYLLGRLLHSKPLSDAAIHEWNGYKSVLPKEVQQPFLNAGFRLGSVQNKLGLAHQYKRYCSQQKCHQCKVFKNAIGS